MKRVYRLMLLLVIVVATLFSSSAICNCATVKENSDECIYFSVPTGKESWGEFDTIYCHIWIDGGDEFFTWQTNPEKCQKVSNKLWKYDLSKLKGSRHIKGGFNKEITYGIIFSDNIGNQTYDLYFTKECIGDTIVCTNAYRGNPIDNTKRCLVAKWKINGDKYDSVEYTKVVEKTMVESPAVEDKEETTSALSEDMGMVIIIMLSVVIVLLLVIIFIKMIKSKK